MTAQVTLQCRDGDLKCALEVANESQTLEQIFKSDLFIESRTLQVDVSDYTMEVVQVAMDYMHYKHQYKDELETAPTFEIPPELSLQVMVLADYLNV